MSETEKIRQAATLKKQQGKGIDAEGRWLKKCVRRVFVFKSHDAVYDNGLILAVHTTTANDHDSKGLSPLLKKLPVEQLEGVVFAYKGYKVHNNAALLQGLRELKEVKERKIRIKNRLMHKAVRNRPLTTRQVLFNQNPLGGRTNIREYQKMVQRMESSLYRIAKDPHPARYTSHSLQPEMFPRDYYIPFSQIEQRAGDIYLITTRHFFLKKRIGCCSSRE